MMTVFILPFIFMKRKLDKSLMNGSVVLFLLWLSGCVAKSGHELRFEDSQRMNAPTLSISGTEDEVFSFLFVGDMHFGGADTSRLQTVLQAAKTHDDAFVVFLGDMIDQGQRADYEAFQKVVNDNGFREKVLYVIGNHDIFDNGWSAFRELMGPSHYSVQIGNCKFVTVDSADGVVGEKQTQWIKEQLTGVSDSSHLFLLSHYMPFIPEQRTYLKLSNETEAVELMKMMSRFGVEAWLGGHYHSFERESIDGVNYIVAGGGGGRRMNPIKDLFYVRANVQKDKVTYELQRF